MKSTDRERGVRGGQIDFVKVERSFQTPCVTSALTSETYYSDIESELEKLDNYQINYYGGNISMLSVEMPLLGDAE